LTAKYTIVAWHKLGMRSYQGAFAPPSVQESAAAASDRLQLA